MRRNRAGERVVIVGIVEVAECDGDDNITAVAIRNLDDDRYLVEGNGRGRELLCLRDDLVEVVGILGREGNGARTVRVERYQIIQVELD